MLKHSLQRPFHLRFRGKMIFFFFQKFNIWLPKNWRFKWGWVLVTPVARPIFETKNRAIFLERFFGRGMSGEASLPYNLVPINWLWSGSIFPELEHL